MSIQILEGPKSLESGIIVSSDHETLGEPAVEVKDFPSITDRIGDHISATPVSILLGSLPDPVLFLREPITLDVEKEDGSFAVSSSEIDEFGVGEYLMDAVEDFQQSLVELYLTLRENQNSLGPAMMALWARLVELIGEREWR